MGIYNKVIRKGDIYYAILKGKGSVQNGERPVIISSNDLNNEYAPTVQVIPLTKELKKMNLPVHVLVGTEFGLNYPSLALAEQEQTIDKMDLLDKIGKCNKEILHKLDNAICIQKGINEIVSIPYINHLARTVIMYSNLIKKLNLNTDDIIYYQSTLQELKIYCEYNGVDYKKILQNTMKNERDEMKCSLKKIVGAIY